MPSSSRAPSRRSLTDTLPIPLGADSRHKQRSKSPRCGCHLLHCPVLYTRDCGLPPLEPRSFVAPFKARLADLPKMKAESPSHEVS